MASKQFWGSVLGSVPTAGRNFMTAMKAAEEAAMERSRRLQDEKDKDIQRQMQMDQARRQLAPVAPAADFYQGAPEGMQLNQSEALAAMQRKMQADQRAKELEMASEAKAQAAADKPSIFQKRADTKAADIVSKWVYEGGRAEAERGLAGLNKAISTLKGDKDIGGPIAGRVPDFFKGLSKEGRKSLDVKQVIENEVQRSLRETLGAQFTEREGERLISRAYNENLTVAENLPRLRRLVTAMKRAKQAKDDMAKFAIENQTLEGYTGSIFNEDMSSDAFLDQFAPEGENTDGSLQGQGWKIERVE